MDPRSQPPLSHPSHETRENGWDGTVFSPLKKSAAGTASSAHGVCGLPWATRAAGGFLQEDLGEAEAAAGDFAGVVVVDQGETLLPHFGLEDLPGLLRHLLGV